MGLNIYFFFSSRRRHTRSDRDWSSDVCSSDLHPAQQVPQARLEGAVAVGATETSGRLEIPQGARAEAAPAAVGSRCRQLLLHRQYEVRERRLGRRELRLDPALRRAALTQMQLRYALRVR